MPYCITNGIQTYYETRGSGPPLVLITGLTGDTFTWVYSYTEFLQGLKDQFQLILYDPRCSGRSDWPKESFNASTFAEDLKDLLDHLNIVKTHIYGVSMGSIIAQLFTIKYPERVEKIILASSASNTSYITQEGKKLLQSHREGDLYEDTLKATKFLMDNDTYQKQEDVIKKMIKQQLDARAKNKYPKQSPIAYRNQRNAILGFQDTSQELMKLSHPVLILKPEADKLINPDASEQLHEILKNSQIIRYPNAIHGTLPPVTDMDLEPLIAFLKS